MTDFQLLGMKGLTNLSSQVSYSPVWSADNLQPQQEIPTHTPSMLMGAPAISR